MGVGVVSVMLVGVGVGTLTTGDCRWGKFTSSCCSVLGVSFGADLLGWGECASGCLFVTFVGSSSWLLCCPVGAVWRPGASCGLSGGACGVSGIGSSYVFCLVSCSGLLTFVSFLGQCLTWWSLALHLPHWLGSPLYSSMYSTAPSPSSLGKTTHSSLELGLVF
jgi:hypothetical protein